MSRRDRYEPVAAEPTVLGRFTELRKVGMGGMGIVYAAHDPMLDRKVALKLLRPHRNAPEDSIRMIREAQAMARLIHPNVVAVHDVGIIDGCVFLAMDYIEGQTFRQLDLDPAQWRRIIELYLQAGQGLAAAHEAQLVHRDFKPENVLLGVDSRVRVLDFGLARANHEHEEVDRATKESTQAARRSSALNSPLTESGAILGTPAYMAPEQFLGQEADALSDQFSFCVALYEQLYHQRPFVGTNAAELSDNVIHGKLCEPPARTRAPRRVFTALRRGLSPSPASRWPSIRALLAELELSVSRGRGWRLAALPLTGLVSVGVYSLVAGTDAPPTEACSDPSRLLADVWDEGARSAVRTALNATRAPYAEDTAGRVEKHLDQYAALLTATYTRSCEATYTRGEQPIRTHELKAECIEERRDELKAFVQVLGTADESIVSNAVEAASHLSSLKECDNPLILEERQELRSDPARATAVQRLRSKLVEVKSLETFGRSQEGLAIATEVLSEARTLGFPRVEALALWNLGNLHENLAEYKRAEVAMSDAFFAAESTREDLLAISAAAALVRISLALSEIPQGLVWARHGEAVLRRTGTGTREHGELLNSIGVIEVAQGRYEEAQTTFEAALKIEPDLPEPNELNTSAILLNLGNLCMRQGKFELAEQHLLRVRDVYLRLLGPEHPIVAIVDNNLGEVLLAKNDLDTARTHYERALALMQRTIGNDHPNMGVPITNLGLVYLRLGDHVRSREYLTRGQALFTRVLGDEHVFLGYPLTGLGELELAEGRFEAAAEVLERALRLREGSPTPTEEVAQTQFALARALWQIEGSRARALTLAHAAEKRYASAGGGSALPLSDVRTWLVDQETAP